MTAETDLSFFLQWRKRLRSEEEKCPWPGPRPLNRHDGLRLLIGRERDRRLFNHEVQNHRLILLGGESGVGKSSLLDAGLVPDLESAGYTVVVCRNWGVDIEADDGAFLAHAVYSALDPSLQRRVSDDEELFDKLDDEFGDWLVVVFDQFEELLRYNQDRKERITKLLLGIHQTCAIRMVLSFRSEYLHELKDIESGATPFGISRYMLDAVEDKYALQVIGSARESATKAIEPTVAADLAKRWARARAREGGSSVLVARVGLLHLQAMLYALHDRASGKTIDDAVLRAVRNDASRQGSDTTADAGRDSSDAALFAFGLQEAVSVKLRRCKAAAMELRMDDYLIRGASTLLRSAVAHLSSGGYKLVREAYDLAKAVMKDQVEACIEAIADPETGPVSGEVGQTAFLRRMLSAIADDALRESDAQALAVPAGAPPVSPPDVGTSINGLRPELAAKADLMWQTGELAWADLRKAGLTAGNTANPAAGPMRGLHPADVLIEELRRFAWALVWLKESNLVRITRHGQYSMVSLIHDGFGEALLQWAAAYKKRDRTWAIYALTAPSGESHVWRDEHSWRDASGNPVTIRSELCGTPEVPRVLANLCFKGNSIMFAHFYNTVFVNCDFRGVMFLRCSFEGTTLVNCQLDGALFSDCTVIGRPDPAADKPTQVGSAGLVPADPKFNVPGAEELARVFRRYREPGGDAPVETHLVAQETGRPAAAVAEPLQETESWLPWTPANAGLVAYGSRISALTFRGTTFASEGTISFRGVTGSGLDLAELSDAHFEFHRCLLRHVAFTSGQRSDIAELDVRVAFSVIAQWWIGDGFKGRLSAEGSQLAQLWNDSAHMEAAIGTNKTIHAMGPDELDDAGTDLRTAVGRTDYRRT